MTGGFFLHEARAETAELEPDISLRIAAIGIDYKQYPCHFIVFTDHRTWIQRC